MGTTADMRARKSKRRYAKARYRAKIGKARNLIYKQGRAIQSKPVEELLKDESYVPTMNAFSDKLSECKTFDFFECLVVDQLHEVELGVWKSLFKHLIRLLYSAGSRNVTEFNKRFRKVPTFASAIRLFAHDVADMGRIAARDFEDILQCCMPVFEGLLPEKCDRAAQDLLFVFAHWHGMAKLRLHTDDSLKTFRVLTSKLGTKLRDFARLTHDMDIRETPKEYARRRKQYEGARALSMTKRAQVGTSMQRKAGSRTGVSSDIGLLDGLRLCVLNLNTYKFHALGDYPYTIENFGTTDSYSTQIGELQNRKIKAQYLRTNKQESVLQMTRVHDIISVLEEMDKELTQVCDALARTPEADVTAANSLLNGEAYSIGQTERSQDTIPNFTMWVKNQQNDPAMKFFIPQLKRYLLAQILGSTQHSNYTEPELVYLQIHEGRLHRHKTLRINYTSYDILRQQDSLNSSTSHCYALLATNFDQEPDSEEATHPYIYAKIIGVYHANVVYRGRRPKRIDFVHVRWLYYDYDSPGGWDHGRLDRVSYQECQTDQDVLDSFDFVHPSDIIRATHLIPGFVDGTTTAYLGPTRSIAHDEAECEDWKFYYVNRDEDEEDNEEVWDDRARNGHGGQDQLEVLVDEDEELDDNLLKGSGSDDETVYSEEDRDMVDDVVEESDDDLYGF
ncbi:unnamed protein product [Rhizoctonia solani]|uniref:Uncharacterized protein n=1 Tax=Rhizoctonia solani TaxID=456999 RepID=A0A8H3B0Q4_9AGAM|nr:unnamed protein product [Rhizoctonia solani]CAE6444768.1 unnamed protein product [Rhizoctonia solani]